MWWKSNFSTSRCPWTFVPESVTENFICNSEREIKKSHDSTLRHNVIQLRHLFHCHWETSNDCVKYCVYIYDSTANKPVLIKNIDFLKFYWRYFCVFIMQSNRTSSRAKRSRNQNMVCCKWNIFYDFNITNVSKSFALNSFLIDSIIKKQRQLHRLGSHDRIWNMIESILL